MSGRASLQRCQLEFSTLFELFLRFDSVSNELTLKPAQYSNLSPAHSHGSPINPMILACLQKHGRGEPGPSKAISLTNSTSLTEYTLQTASRGSQQRRAVNQLLRPLWLQNQQSRKGKPPGDYSLLPFLHSTYPIHYAPIHEGCFTVFKTERSE